jgi:hypothetical protein
MSVGLGTSDHGALTDTLGVQSEDEYHGNIINGVVYQVWKMYDQARKDEYAFGVGVNEFPHWMQTHHPGQYRRLSKVLGSRFDVYFKNPLVVYFMAPYYVEYLKFLDHGGAKEAGSKLLSLLTAEVVIAAVRARALWHEGPGLRRKQGRASREADR